MRGSAANDSVYALSLFGPNGFVRQFGGNLTFTGAAASLVYAPQTRQVTVVLANSLSASQPLTFTITDNAYGILPQPLRVVVPGGSTVIQRSVDVSGSGNWYDLSVTVAASTTPTTSSSLSSSSSSSSSGGSVKFAFLRRFMGRMETGVDSISDPAMSTGVPVASTTLQGLQGISSRPHLDSHPDIPESVRHVKIPKPTHKDMLGGQQMKDEL